MSIVVSNTLSRRKDSLEPLEPGVVRLFVCGPTVYDWPHIGHAKTYTQFDFIARYLRWRGFQVRYVQNITDIDDKIIDRADREGMSVRELAELYETRYREDMEALGNTSVDIYARASEHIDEIVSQILRLIERGNAYELPDGYYFDITTFAGYGKLSRRQEVAPDDAVSRVDENPLKRHPGDFALWKRRKSGEPFWDTRLGPGRPGWHIEDTAITEHYFGPQYDIHGGAVDLIFPHHEAEIAQMESISGRAPLAKYWMHTGFLNINDTKMSKSLGNTFTIRNMLERVDARLLRFFLLSYHYRSAIEYTDDLLSKARGALRRIENFYSRLPEGDGDTASTDVAEARERIVAALDNDFDTPAALAALFDFIRAQNRQAAPSPWSRALLEELNTLFQFLPPRADMADVSLEEAVRNAIAEREALRREKRFAEADAIRDSLGQRGIVLEDTPDGVRWHKLTETHKAT
jgi:cysteinyl-tRNA synthetase